MAAGAGAAGYAPTQRPEPMPGGREPRPAADPHRRTRPAGSPSPRERDSRGAPPRPPVPGRDQRGGTGRPRKRRRFRIGRILLAVLLLFIVASVGLVFYYDSKLNRIDALTAYSGRPADTPGTNWLIVGTDSRADLSAAQRRTLSTGDSDGARTDTIMLVHKPPSGRPMIISIPRDLYVPIPGQGSHKVNSAFTFGGPQLLVQTIEQFSKVRIDHYGEIGFGGFDTLVDSVGGIDMCLNQALVDPKAGLRLKAGCQHLDGRQALGLVRTRAFPNADLVRVVNQRKFLSALMSKATSPSVIANPFRLFPFVNGAVDSLTVDTDDHIWNLIGLAFALRDDPITTTTPTAGSEYTDDGDSLVVGDNTTQFFEHIRTGTKVPDSLLQNTGGVLN
nr:LCP family protein [Gordonia soli]